MRRRIEVATTLLLILLAARSATAEERLPDTLSVQSGSGSIVRIYPWLKKAVVESSMGDAVQYSVTDLGDQDVAAVEALVRSGTWKDPEADARARELAAAEGLPPPVQMRPSQQPQVHLVAESRATPGQRRFFDMTESDAKGNPAWKAFAPALDAVRARAIPATPAERETGSWKTPSRAMSDEAVDSLADMEPLTDHRDTDSVSFHGEYIDADRLPVLRDYLKNRTLTTAQAARLMEKFTETGSLDPNAASGTGQLGALATILPHLSDPENFTRLRSSLRDYAQAGSSPARDAATGFGRLEARARALASSASPPAAPPPAAAARPSTSIGLGGAIDRASGADK